MLTSNLLSLGNEISLLEKTGIKLIHVDVMDGCFCPAMTVGPPVVKAIKTPLLKDIHLMITEPLEKVADYVAAGADIVTIHPEACSHVHRVLQKLGTMTNVNDKDRGIVRGVALNPGTPLEVIEPLLGEVELILILAVNPGWGGQPFIPATAGRIARAQRMIATAGRNILVGVDGGITKENISAVAETGVDVIVTGSAVFDGKAPEANARFMLEAAAKAVQSRGYERGLRV
jgi:ribulose-phosphate 3-epimerase